MGIIKTKTSNFMSMLDDEKCFYVLVDHPHTVVGEKYSELHGVNPKTGKAFTNSSVVNRAYKYILDNFDNPESGVEDVFDKEFLTTFGHDPTNKDWKDYLVSLVKTPGISKKKKAIYYNKIDAKLPDQE